MPIRIVCSGCSKSIKLPEKYAGKRIKCPACGEGLYVPMADGVTDDDLAIQPFEDEQPSAAPGAAPAASGQPGFCPMCGKPTRPDVMICISCGTNVVTGEQIPGSIHRKTRGPRFPTKMVAQILVILVAIGVGYYGYNRFFGKNGKTTTPEGSSAASSQTPDGTSTGKPDQAKPDAPGDTSSPGQEKTEPAKVVTPPKPKGPTTREQFDAAMAKMADPLERAAALRDITNLGPTALPLVRENLGNEDPAIRSALVSFLIQCPIADVKADFTALAADPDASVRDAAARGLGAFRDGNIGVCLELAASENSLAREVAVRAISVNRKSPEALEAVKKATGDQDAGVRYAAITALVTDMQEASSIPLLVGALSDRDMDVADMAAQGLVRHRREVIPDLAKSFDAANPRAAYLSWRILNFSPSTAMRDDIAKRIHEVKGRNTPNGRDLGAKLITVTSSAGQKAVLDKVNGLAKMDPGIVPFLALKLAEENQGPTAARSLRKTQDTYIIFPLVLSLADKDSVLVDEAVSILAQQPKSDELLECLRQASSSRDTQRRIFASGILAKLGEGNAADEVLKALRDTSLPGGIRGIAAKTLADLGDKRALEALEVYISQEKLSPMERLGYLVAAARLGREGGYSEVVDILTKGTDVNARRAAAVVLANVDEDDVKNALVMCFTNANEDVNLRIECMKSIAKAGKAHAAPILAEQIGKLSGKLTTAVTNALVDIGKDAEESVIRVLKEGDDKSKAQAMQIAAKLGSTRCYNALLDVLKDKDATALHKKAAENALSGATGKRFYGNIMMWEHFINPDSPLDLTSIKMVTGGQVGANQRCAAMEAPGVWSSQGTGVWIGTKWPGRPTAKLSSSYSGESKHRGSNAALLKQYFERITQDSLSGKAKKDIKVKQASISRPIGRGRLSGFIYEDTDAKPPKTTLWAVAVVQGKVVEGIITLEMTCESSEWSYYWPLFNKMFKSVVFVDPSGGVIRR